MVSHGHMMVKFGMIAIKHEHVLAMPFRIYFFMLVSPFSKY